MLLSFPLLLQIWRKNYVTEIQHRRSKLLHEKINFVYCIELKPGRKAKLNCQKHVHRMEKQFPSEKYEKNRFDKRNTEKIINRQ